jgi:hypothetical protein
MRLELFAAFLAIFYFLYYYYYYFLSIIYVVQIVTKYFYCASDLDFIAAAITNIMLVISSTPFRGRIVIFYLSFLHLNPRR